jgi:hypothetical protein
VLPYKALGFLSDIRVLSEVLLILIRMRPDRTGGIGLGVDLQSAGLIMDAERQWEGYITYPEGMILIGVELLDPAVWKRE